MNLAIGQSYVMYLATMDGVNGDLIRLLGSYNAGPTSFVRMQAAMPEMTDPLLFIESIPNDETRGFVARALAYSWIYAERGCTLPAPSLDTLSAGEWPTVPGPGAAARCAGAPSLKGVARCRSTQSRRFLPVAIAVLTVSDTRNATNDTSGDTLVARRVEAAGHTYWRVARSSVTTRNWSSGACWDWIADPAVDVVITTGGTGITGRDVTPGGVRPCVGEADRRIRRAIPDAELTSKIGTSTIQSRAIGGVARRHLPFRAARQHRAR